jgi:hypothetical protein
MAIRRELLLILALILVIAVLVKLIEFFQVNVVEADASKFVLEDLRSKYPQVDPAKDIEIMTIIQKTNQNGQRYFEVKARVTEGAGTPCPERSHIFYNYPAQNFVPQLPEVITSGCRVCTEGICTIAFPEEAVIASHTFNGTGEVSGYLRLFPDAVPSVMEQEDAWKVAWSSPSAEYSYEMVLRRDGNVTGVKLLQKG